MESAYSESEVRAAIIRSLSARRFQTESEDAGAIQAKSQRGDESIQIAIEYSGSQYRVKYLHSEGIASERRGKEVLLESSYHSQIEKLKKQIDRELKRPAKEAAAQAAASQPAEPQQQVDTRNPGQVVVDIMISGGHACVTEEARWLCTPPGDSWPVTVAYFVEPTGATTIWFDSYSNRAFAKRCSRFNAAMQDLHKPQSAFLASCDDEAQAFRFNTAVAYGADLDVNAWLANHFERRSEAYKLLASIGAIRK